MDPITTGTTPTRNDWHKTPIVFVVAPCCPYCGCDKWDRSRTDSNGDGSVTRYCRCRECEKRFKICIEQSPVSGVDVVWPE